MQNKQQKIVLGIDPGYDRVGYAIMVNRDRKETVLASGCIETNRQDSFAERLATIASSLQATINTWKPTTLAIETIYFKQNKTTGIKVAEARGVMLYIAYTNGLDVLEFGPGTIKSTVTGNGRASKAELIKMIQLTTGVTKVTHDDEYDAIGIGITGLLTQNLTVPQPIDR